MMTRGRAKIPDPGIAWTGQQGVPDQFVASPLADDGARDVSNVVLVEAQHRAEARLRQGLARARQTIAVKSLEVHTLFEIHLSGARRLKRTMPSMRRLEIILVNGEEFGFVEFLRHDTSPWISR